jgi:predicted house-cleaning noncanonical NTP pyrophosphatase (MazG superfamily)
VPCGAAYRTLSKQPPLMTSREAIYAADADEYAARLRDKLSEEVTEFLASDSDPEGLADVLEVVTRWPS